MIVVRYADDTIVGFQHRPDAERFLIDLKERLAKFALSLHPEKTRLLEFGRYAAERRAERGQGKPETFDFLGLTHYCTTRKGGADFQLGRKTQRKRMKAKLREIKETLRRHRHTPIDEQGRWLGTMMKGYFAYFAVPTNTYLLSAFRYHTCRPLSNGAARSGGRRPKAYTIAAPEPTSREVAVGPQPDTDRYSIISSNAGQESREWRQTARPWRATMRP
jgi:hypothetical protein